jgi:hypothetical protein
MAKEGIKLQTSHILVNHLTTIADVTRTEASVSFPNISYLLHNNSPKLYRQNRSGVKYLFICLFVCFILRLFPTVFQQYRRVVS